MRANKSLAGSPVASSSVLPLEAISKIEASSSGSESEAARDTFNSNATLSLLAAEMVSRRHEKEFHCAEL